MNMNKGLSQNMAQPPLAVLNRQEQPRASVLQMFWIDPLLHFGGLWCLVGIILASTLIASARGQAIAEGATGNSNVGQAAAEPESIDKLLDLADKDVGQLSQVRVAGMTGSPSLDMPVSSVSRQESTVGRSPAAVFVITNEMIRRSGAKEIPEVLRMVPGMNIAKIDSNTWAVSARGFNGRFANALLVRIDGRDVYDPLFGGTFWDVQEVVLEDVERIEVIRGPGASVWGANAVNGVINIITKNAKDTNGVYVESIAGTFERGTVSARYGAQVNEELNYRFYGKWFDRAPGFLPDDDACDAWNQGRGGFRTDWTPTSDDFITFQGEYYNGYSGELDRLAKFSVPYYYLTSDKVHVAGDNAVLNWKRVLDEKSDWDVKLYYDQTQRHWNQAGENRNTFDFDFQNRFPVGERHELIWGLGYRNSQSFIFNSPTLMMYPTQKTDYIGSCFVQDQITLREERWFLTVGSKFEQNNYTGFEYQPTARLLFTPDKKYSLWCSVSRAIRMPTQGEECSTVIAPAIGMAPPYPPLPPGPDVPMFPLVFGNTHLLSEEMMAYEAGIRGQSTESFSWDLAVFNNNYDRLIFPVIGTPYGGSGPADYLPMTLTNSATGNTYGFELVTTYQATERWKLQSAYTFLVMNLQSLDGTAGSSDVPGNDPRNQVYLQSSWDLWENWDLDLIGRYSDELPSIGIPSYVVADVRLAWHAQKNLELSIVGRNLLNGQFYEFGSDNFLGTQATKVQPEVYGQIIWRR
jgi:iron complex outermembrane recepter protein